MKVTKKFKNFSKIKDNCPKNLDEINLMDFHFLLIIDAYKENESILKFKNILTAYNLKIKNFWEIKIPSIPYERLFSQSKFFYFK